MERDPCGDLQQRYVENFNSHAHVERDRLKVATLQLMKGISTHTLTWSVTADPKSNSRSYGYFNSHAHVERDRRFSTASIIPTHFNSHAHVERDMRLAQGA